MIFEPPEICPELGTIYETTGRCAYSKNREFELSSAPLLKIEIDVKPSGGERGQCGVVQRTCFSDRNVAGIFIDLPVLGQLNLQERLEEYSNFDPLKVISVPPF